LVECSTQESSLADSGLEVIQQLLEEDDENIELWYLGGVACLSTTPPDATTSVEYLAKAYEMFEANREYCVENEMEFENQSEMDLVVSHLEMANEILSSSSSESSTSQQNNPTQEET